MTSISPPPSNAGRWFLFGIGLFLALLGALFVWLLGRSYLRAKEMQSWPAVECVILNSEVEERQHDPISPTEYRHQVMYGYEWDGQPYTSERMSLRGSRWTSHRGRAEQQVEAYPAGTNAICYLQPNKPGFAVLERDSLAPGYSIWFPGLFLVGGLVISIRSLGRRSQGFS